MNKEFENIKNALEEHLSAINENTTEIQALFDYIQDLENKFDKLSQRLDQMQLEKNKEIKKEIIPLNQTEKKVFLTLYTESTPLSQKDIANLAKVPFSTVSDCIASLNRKGIPFTRTIYNNQILIKINPNFKERQAKENLINLSLSNFLE